MTRIIGQAFLVFIFVCLAFEAYAEGNQPSRTFILVNGQEAAAGWTHDVNVPILFFCLSIGDDGKASTCLLDAFPAEGHRNLQVLKDYGMVLVELSRKSMIAVFDLKNLGQKKWISFHRRPLTMTVAKTDDGKDLFIVGTDWENGEHKHVTFLNENPKNENALFSRDNIIIGERTIDDIIKGLSIFRIIYDKSTSCLANWNWTTVVEVKGSTRIHHSTQKCYPLTCDYPPALKELLSSPVYENILHRCCSMIRNDAKTRLIACLNPERNELFFYSYDHEMKEWYSLAFLNVRPGEYGESWDEVLKWSKWELDALVFADMDFTLIDSWLCQATNAHDGMTEDLVFYSLPDLKERFRWTSVRPLKKLLYMKDGFMLYADGGEIWAADYDEKGISNRRLLVCAPYLEGVRCAFEMPEGSLGNAVQWQSPKLRQQSVSFSSTDATIEYYVTEPPK